MHACSRQCSAHARPHLTRLLLPPALPYRADEGIPDFWLTALTNHDMVGEYVREQDAEALSYLTGVRVVSLTGDDAGSFRLEFEFRENPFFSNKVRPGGGRRC